MKKRFRGFLFSFLALTPACLLAQGAQDYRDMGQALAQKGLYAKAIGYFQQAVQANPNDWQSYQSMGDAYLKMNDNANALAAYQKSLQINPNNQAVQEQVNNLGGSTTAPPNPPAQSTTSTPPNAPSGFEESQPTTVIESQPVYGRPRRRPRPQAMNYNDGMAAMNHAKFWTKLELGYNYAQQEDLVSGAVSYNSEIQTDGWSGSVQGVNSGLLLGAELGFQLNPYNALALGVRYLRTADYNVNVDFQPGNSSPDFQEETLSPNVVPLTLDYYLFLPDSGGRFFLTAGVGYYFGDVHVGDNYSLVNNGGNADNITGDLTSGDVGFQVGIGHDFAISRTFALSVFVRGHYAKLTNFQGTLYGNNGYGTFGLAKFSDGTVDIDNAGHIGGNGESYATIDETGFDAGVALNFYSF